MCDVISGVAADPSIPAANRRQFLQVLGVTAAAGGLLAAGAAPASAGGPGASGGSRPKRTRLVLLGTAGGPGILGAERAGISTAIAYRDRVYVVDLGLSSLQRLRQSSLSGPAGVASTLSNVRGIFFTHLHSDHLMDWPATYATGPINTMGRTGPPIQVFGPGARGTLPRVFPPNRPAPPVFAPQDPTPGITGMTEHLTRAWAADFNDRARDSNFAGPQSTFAVQDIDLSGIWAPDPLGIPPRLQAPIPVWTDDEVTVTATLVDHHAAAPAFGFRFDTPDGSVTVSGDTAVSENLIDLARDTDYLVHEVIDPGWVARLVATLPPEVGGPLGNHLLESHTTIEQVGRDVAEKAGAKNLVLTHLVPGDNPTSRWQRARQGYSGRLVVGADLMELAVR
ncbi:Metal-dependent hydrolases of the beta-lactamase superfamily [Modestobacter italicus]|uniref:Metal-dependent hydrolases of the beta-lactamase superfamily n=1 Tax=Modestobacter italicus (strain DSM 44449 / CECT 9708 / BC 501) TaxID=2732864 RepID=I4EYE4_MODI5|nr:MBL fold metallo-hydrolase [Modestobacter marinus]CCH88407.1 Metal-dependent hydrolases of the beta-lactamase superfamily [Modestobacter marinus]